MSAALKPILQHEREGTIAPALAAELREMETPGNPVLRARAAGAVRRWLARLENEAAALVPHEFAVRAAEGDAATAEASEQEASGRLGELLGQVYADASAASAEYHRRRPSPDQVAAQPEILGALRGVAIIVKSAERKAALAAVAALVSAMRRAEAAYQERRTAQLRVADLRAAEQRLPLAGAVAADAALAAVAEVVRMSDAVPDGESLDGRLAGAMNRLLLQATPDDIKSAPGVLEKQPELAGQVERVAALKAAASEPLDVDRLRGFSECLAANIGAAHRLARATGQMTFAGNALALARRAHVEWLKLADEMFASVGDGESAAGEDDDGGPGGWPMPCA